MLYGERAVPLDILEKVGINHNKLKFIISGSNISVKIPKKLTKELAYLVGFLRDGTVSRECQNEYLCAFYNKDKQLINIIKTFLDKTFELDSKIEFRDDCNSIRIRSFTLYLFFKLIFGVKKQFIWNTPEIIKKSSKEIKKWYVSGFFDAEGGAPHIEKYSKTKRKNLYISFNQKHKEPLDFIKKFLDEQGIKTGEVYWKSDEYVLKIKSKYIKHFLKFIKPQSKIKKLRLIKIAEVFS